MAGWGAVIGIEAQQSIFYALAGNIAINNCFNAKAVLALKRLHKYIIKQTNLVPARKIPDINARTIVFGRHTGLQR